jgi:splicing factor 3B subunit 3
MQHTVRRFLPHPNKKGLYVTLQGDCNVDSHLFLQKNGTVGVNPRRSSSSTLSSSTTNNSTTTTTTTAKREKIISEDDMDMDIDDSTTTTATATTAMGGQQQPSSNQLPSPETHPDSLGYRSLGYARVPGAWASSLMVMNDLGTILQTIEFDKDEIGISIEFVTFQNGGECLIVGSVVGLKLHPRSFVQCRLRTYRISSSNPNGFLEFLHTTQVDDLPLSLCAFDGRFVCGVGSTLTLFDLGMKQLLRKCELRKGFSIGGLIPFIKRASDTRLVVGDANESVMFVFYKKTDNSFHIFSDDPLSRLCTSAGDVVDFNTCVAGDKFGNVFVLRLPAGATGDDPKSVAAASKSLLWDQNGLMGGAPHKLSCEAHFYVGEMLTSVNRTQMNAGKADCVVYTTILGSIGTLTPFDSVDDLDFFALLELQMRRFYKSLIGRDHLSWRSYYVPCKNVIDGDLCEEFFSLEDSIKQNIAKEMDRTVSEIEKRIKEARGWVFW